MILVEQDPSILKQISTPYCAIASSKADDPGLQRVFNKLRKYDVKGRIFRIFSMKI